MGKKLNIQPGDKFSRLIIIKEVEKRNKARFFLCKCDCGTEKVIRMVQLTTGGTKSCGCYKRDHLINENYKHGHSRTKLYKVWTSIKQRCLNKKAQAYEHYGARRITIAKEWLDFEIFRKWALNNGYKRGLSIDRIDVNGNYEPFNCRWATIKEQSNNRRTNHIVEWNGKSKTLKEWSETLNINYNTLRKRFRIGWSVDEVFSTPVGGKQ